MTDHQPTPLTEGAGSSSVAPQEAAPAEAPAGPGVSDEEITDALKELLKTVDLQTTTEKKLRKELEEKFGIDLSDKKAMIRAEVEAFLAQAEGGEEEEEDGEEEERAPRSKKRNNGSALGSVLSPALAAFVGTDRMPRPQVVKAIWDYIKANNLQDPKDKRNILLDDKLQTIFTAPVTMFSMNKQLTKHCKTSDAASAGDDWVDDDEGDDDGEPKPKKAKRAKKAADGEAKPNGFQKPVRLSDELAEFLGTDGPMSRPEITKKFWEYFKSNQLQDPSDKRMIKSDERLQHLLGVKSFQAFGLMKYLKDHILKD